MLKTSEYVKEGNINKTEERSSFLSETILSLLLTWGILLSVRDLMNDQECLVTAAAAGSAVILLLQGLKNHPKVQSRLHIAMYAVCAILFLLFIRVIPNGFLDSVNRLLEIWNVEFSTEMRTFTITGSVQLGADLFWILLAVPIAMGVLSVMTEKHVGVETVLVALSLLAGFILSRYSSVWTAIFFLLGGFLGTLVYVMEPEQSLHFRGCLYLILALVAVGGFATIAREYAGYNALSAWKQEIANVSSASEANGDIHTLLSAAASAVCFLYLLLVVYLLLELQRSLRICYRKKWGYTEDIDDYLERLCLLLKLAGVKKSNHCHPVELAGEAVEAFPGITTEEYEQIMNLLQKVQSGQKGLHATEQYTLECFMKKLEKILYEKRRFLRRSWLRYRYVINW